MFNYSSVFISIDVKYESLTPLLPLQIENLGRYIMDTVWVENPAEPSIPMKNKFDVKSEPQYDTMIKHEVEPDSTTDSVLEAHVQVKNEPEAVIRMKSEPEKVISIKNEPEGDVCLKREVEVDVCVKSEPEADDWLERELETVLEFPEIESEDSKVSVFRFSSVCILN